MGRRPEFYGVYFGLIVVATALVLAPGTPLGVLTNAVQTLAGVLLPSASVFLLLLCNDRAVLGPWAKSRNLNLFTGVVVAALVMLSLILTLSVLFTGITESQLLAIFIGGCIAAAVTAIGVRLAIPARPPTPAAKAQGPTVVADRVDWRMPLLDELPPAQLTKLNVIWLIVLRAYLFVAAGLVLMRIIMLALGN